MRYRYCCFVLKHRLKYLVSNFKTYFYIKAYESSVTLLDMIKWCHSKTDYEMYFSFQHLIWKGRTGTFSLQTRQFNLGSFYSNIHRTDYRRFVKTGDKNRIFHDHLSLLRYCIRNILQTKLENTDFQNPKLIKTIIALVKKAYIWEFSAAK